MARLALINTATQEIVSTHVAGSGRVRAGDVSVSPPVSGWTHGDYKLVAIVAPDPAPEGQHIASVSQAIVGGQVVETATYEDDPPAPVPNEVSRRQFKMQLAIAGLTETVEGWVATQDQLVQIAYAESGSFKRDEPMMQTGFDALGLTSEQVDAFFTAAAAL